MSEGQFVQNAVAGQFVQNAVAASLALFCSAFSAVPLAARLVSLADQWVCLNSAEQ